MGSMSRKIQAISNLEQEFFLGFWEFKYNLPLHYIDHLAKIMGMLRSGPQKLHGVFNSGMQKMYTVLDNAEKFAS